MTSENNSVFLFLTVIQLPMCRLKGCPVIVYTAYERRIYISLIRVYAYTWLQVLIYG
jgi:hypothetical protein